MNFYYFEIKKDVLNENEIVKYIQDQIFILNIQYPQKTSFIFLDKNQQKIFVKMKKFD